MPDPTATALVLLSTFPSAEKATEVAKILVEERLAACVNLVSGIRSIYRWQGTVCDDSEVLAVIKTTQERYEALAARLLALHPYEVPELIVLPVIAGHAPYLGWLGDQVRD
ncbi:MAG: divalent-cation tolerance protein CutA [Kofleriaceae bacterium]|nr:divalent-cation tolerance protein CutA [Kofleriaceae bacterium]